MSAALSHLYQVVFTHQISLLSPLFQRIIAPKKSHTCGASVTFITPFKKLFHCAEEACSVRNFDGVSW